MFENTKPTKKHDPKVFQEYMREVPTGKRKKELNDVKAELNDVKAELKEVKAELERSKKQSAINVANKKSERKKSDREAAVLRNDRGQLFKTLELVKYKVENIKTSDEDSTKKLDNIWDNIKVALKKSGEMEKKEKEKGTSKKKKKKSRRRKKK